jgi:Fic family protein
MNMSSEQITAVTAPVEAEAERRSIESLLFQAREAKTYDVYHSTSLEGYRIRYEDVSVLLGEAAAGGSSEEEIRNRMAVLGYSHAFDRLLERVELAHGPVQLTDTLVLDLYVDLFQPSVEAGIVEPELLRGWRTSSVFIRNTRYVPPAADHVGELMARFLDRLEKEGHAIARAVLAHLILVTIHPFPDGNGRVARFLMNAVLLGGGLPWVTIEEGDRREYFDVLKAAQLHEDAGPFAEFILERVVRSLERFGSSNGVS